ncbi:hypothetical protein [Rhizobium sp. NFR03]|uniref:hypothetical protein n=1 Tax=Rhizobium sp. NFR03 TaxID=1566263 RepID=UPI0008C8C23B|nr:hypothetical protein [Rhizobium sp. NFR03]SER57399.1 hypothetical protein SAMN03159406_00527 [Rhizobium sp. NFR03]
MAIEDKKIPYELLVRYGLDGKPVGAHAVYRRHITLDGEVIKDEVGSAEPIDVAGFPTSSIMSDTTRDALAEIAALNARVDELAEQVNAAADTLETANKHAELLAQENEALIAEVESLQAEIAAMQSSASASAETPSAE